MDGMRCTIFPISMSSGKLFLYVSEWDGAFLALICDKPFLEGGPSSDAGR
jgi:hypothetical protein